MADAPLPTTRVTLLTQLQQDPSDQAAWDEFVELYGRHIYRWCREWKLQDADAEDVTQEILAKPSLLAARTHRRGAQSPHHPLAQLLQHDSLLCSLRRGLGIASGEAAGPLTQRHLPPGPETRLTHAARSNPRMLGSRTTPTSYYGRCLPNLAPHLVDVGRFLGSWGSTSFLSRISCPNGRQSFDPEE